MTGQGVTGQDGTGTGLGGMEPADGPALTPRSAPVGRRQAFDQMRATTKTLRFRLMLWNAGVVLVTALTVLLGLRVGIRQALIHELDAVLIEDLREMRLALEAERSPLDPSLLAELNRKARGHRAHGWFVRLLRADGTPFWSSENAPSPQVPYAGPEQKAFGSEDYRLAKANFPKPVGGVYGVRVGASTQMIDADVRRLDRLVGFACGIVLVVAPLCGYWLADRSLRPISGIIDTASRLRPSRLDERLPNRGTGDELDKLAATVNGLLDRIAAHLRERRDFLANSAHELRSPLAAIRSTAEVALQSGRLAREEEDSLAVVIDQCTSLEHLVNQLLLIAETEAERLIDRTEEVRFDRLVATACDMFAAVADLKGVDLDVGRLPDVTICGNRHHLRQVVNNLLDNAVKFTAARGAVTVRLTADAARNGTGKDGTGAAVLVVSDTGPGISAEDLPQVFDRFFRADRARRREGRGTGLGLSICKAVIAAHGGTIAAASVLGRGTTFTVTLPTAAAIPPGERPATAAAR